MSPTPQITKTTMKKKIKYIINNQEVDEARGKKILKGRTYAVKEIKESETELKFIIQYNY